MYNIIGVSMASPLHNLFIYIKIHVFGIILFHKIYSHLAYTFVTLEFDISNIS